MDNDLLAQLQRADIVSFDVFDTAILRPLARPTDLFALMEPEVGDRGGNGAPAFRAAREWAERAIRDSAWKERRETEVTLAEIYGQFATGTGLPQTAADDIARLEIAAELAVCRANPFVQSVYRWCREHSKRIAFISDTYLPEDTIAELLKSCGYDGYDALFVSCMSGASKANGRLHAQARARFPGKWLHIGDDRKSDVVNARRNGMAAWHYQRCVDRFVRDTATASVWNGSHDEFPAASVVQGLIANRLTHARPAGSASPDPDMFWRDFGYATAGPLLVGFTEWLIEQSLAQKLDVVFFLERDGVIMRRVYKVLAPLTGSEIESRDLFASRRALNFATVDGMDDRALDFLTEGGGLSVAHYFARLGLDMREYMDAVCEAGLGGPRALKAASVDRKRLRALSRLLADTICEKARAERAIVADYLKHSGFRDGRRIGVVDIGWHGTMQRSIADILAMEGMRPHIVGLYLGTHRPAIVDPRYPHVGYFINLGVPAQYSEVILSGVEVIELMLSSPQGSIVRIERGADGDFVAIRQSDPGDTDRNRNIELLQEGAMQFVDEYAALRKRFPNLHVPRQVAMAQLKRVIRYPTRAEAQLIGDIPHPNAHGDFSKRPIAPRYTTWSLLTQPGRSRRALMRDFWRIGRNRRASPLQRAIIRLLTGR
jgi:predicted HAD superfamily hydrolase